MKIGSKFISAYSSCYFIADIAANHDGSKSKAIDLIYLAAEAGADAAKFQNFNAHSIVSDFGFKALGKKSIAHQQTWKKSVFSTYLDASIPIDWTPDLKYHCSKANIDYLTTPYAFDIADKLEPYVDAWKIGSGDITWIDFIKHLAKKDKPLLLATGASNLEEVDKSVKTILSLNDNLVLMQCNTNYTASDDNLRHLNLNVLNTYKKLYPNVLLGLSDHTHGHLSVLGAIALGAKVIEKHFTDNNNLTGPDHKFSMNPSTWKEMIESSRLLETTLGDGIKKVMNNEKESIIVQRRAIRVKKNMFKGQILTKSDLVFLRPCPNDAISPADLESVLNKRINKDKIEQDYLREDDIDMLD